MDDKSNFAEKMPQTIGRYQVLESIGFGAMGAVYKAFDPLIKRTLAIKTIRLDIPRQSPQYKSFIERFYHEARISGTLSHPNIVTLFDIGEEAGVPYLAMEFVEGETISHMLEQGERFDPERVIGLASQVAAALDYAHNKGVIHRDIKPSNLILAETDRVKVTDFGIAKLVDAEMTQSGTLLGTPSYMSPEQAMGDKLDGRSDIFSLGVCAFEMLSGEQPFPGSNVTAVLYKLVHVDPIEPANLEMSGLVPHKWHEVFSKVLAKRPDDRYQTATQFVQDLEYCLGSWFGAMGDATVMVANAPSSAPVTAGTPADDVVTAAMPVLDAAPPGALASRGQAAAPSASEGATVVMGNVAAKAAKGAPPKPPVEDTSTVAMPLLREDKPSLHEDRPLEALVSSHSTPKAPAPEEGATVVMSAPSQAPAAAEGATVVLFSEKRSRSKAAEDDVPATVLMASPKSATLPKPVPAKGAEDATVLMSAVQASSTKAPAATAKMAARAEAMIPPTAKTAPKPAPAPAVRAGRRGPSAVLIVGVAAVTFLLALTVSAIVLWKIRQGRTVAVKPVSSSPATPVAVATPALAVTPEPVVVTHGVLRVSTQPPGASVTVNGETRGESPVEISLPLGLYDVRVELKGYEPWSQSVELTAVQPASEVSRELTRPVGVADVLSTPFGASVTIDGKPMGETPLTDLTLPRGKRNVQIVKEGYVPASGVLVVQAGRRARMDVTLQATVRAAPTPRPDVVDVNRIYTPSEVDASPRQVAGESPNYSPKLKSGQSISVTITFVVMETGEITDLQIAQSGGEELDRAALAAAAKWKFKPGIKRGVSVKVRDKRTYTYKRG